MNHHSRFEAFRVGERDVFARFDAAGAVEVAAASFDGAAAGADERGLADALTVALEGGTARRLPPCRPSKVVCVGLNYRRHAEEMSKPLPEEPLIFLKPSTAVIADGEAIVLPRSSQMIHHEGELAVVIGTRAHAVAESRAMDHVAGFTIMNDVTARDIQRRENKYTRGKGFDTFAPLGPSIVPGLDPDSLDVTTRVNGDVRQHSTCSDLIFPIPRLIAFVSEIMTLLPGDVISTGTPSGVGPIEDGDEVEVEIAPIGVLRSPVVRR